MERAYVFSTPEAICGCCVGSLYSWELLELRKDWDTVAAGASSHKTDKNEELLGAPPGNEGYHNKV